MGFDFELVPGLVVPVVGLSSSFLGDGVGAESFLSSSFFFNRVSNSFNSLSFSSLFKLSTLCVSALICSKVGLSFVAVSGADSFSAALNCSSVLV